MESPSNPDILGGPRASDPDRPHWGVLDMLLAACAFLVLVGLSLGVLFAVERLLHLTRSDLRPVALALSGGGELALVLVAWFFGPFRRGGGWRALGYRRFSPGGALGALVLVPTGLCVGAVYGLLLQAAGLNRFSPPPVHDLIGDSPASLLAVGLLAAVVAPLAEETFFRGFILGGLRQRFGTLPAIALSALAFALFHFDPRVVIPVFILGMLLGGIFVASRSIFPGMIAHGAYNAVVLLAAVGLRNA